MAFCYGWKALKLKRIIEEIPTSKIRSLALGLVEVKSAIVAPQTIESPIRKKKCIYYHTTVEELRSSGKSSHWVTIKNLKIQIPFYVKDETGQVKVFPKDADIKIKEDLSFQTRWTNQIPGDVQAFCNEYRINTRAILGKRPLRFKESFLEPGDFVYVLGTAKDNPAVKEFIDNPDNILIEKSQDTPYFVISDYSERKLLHSLSWQCNLAIFGGPVLFLVSLAYILWYFGRF